MRHQWTYRAGVISFAAEDDPTEEQQSEAMDGFERLAFAGAGPTKTMSSFTSARRAWS